MNHFCKIGNCLSLLTVILFLVIFQSPGITAMPAISNVNPASGFDRDTIVITGTGFDPNPIVTFDGVVALFTS